MKTVTVQCTHGDSVRYPVVTVEISILGKVVIVEAAVLNKLPHSILLGTDVPGFVEARREGSYGCSMELGLQTETELVGGKLLQIVESVTAIISDRVFGYLSKEVILIRTHIPNHPKTGTFWWMPACILMENMATSLPYTAHVQEEPEEGCN